MPHDKKYGIVFPSECFATREEAIGYATTLLTEEEIGAGLYVFEAQEMTHLKTKKSVIEVREGKPCAA